MKVLYVIDTLEIGGAEKSMLDMLPFFRNVELVVCHLYQGDELKGSYETFGAKVINLNLPGPYNFTKASRLLLEVIEAERPDVVHSALVRSSLVCRWIRRKKKIPHIGSLVSDSYVRSRFDSLGWVSRTKLIAVMRINRATSKWCDRYIGISKTIAATNAAYLGIPPEKITVIYRGRDTQKYSPRNADEIRSRFTFMNVARLTNVKGQEILIRAFGMVQQQHTAARLVIVGDGPNMNAYRTLIKKMGLQDKVELRGQVHNVPEVLRTADCFVMPSLLEGLGGAVIEAMLTALPVITSDIPVFREIVDDGTTGLLFRSGDEADLASKMIKLMSDRSLATELGAQARWVAIGKFDIRKVAADYESVYSAISVG